MKYNVLFFFFFSLVSLAQVPTPGIYRLETVATYRNPYEYNYAEKKWLKAKHWPVVTEYKVEYAMVAVDSNLKVKVVLIPKVSPGNAYASLPLLNGFSSRTDSLANVSYSVLQGEDASFEQRPVRYWPTAFRVAENQITKQDTQLVAGKPKPVFTLRPTGSLFRLTSQRPYSSMLCIEPKRVALHSKPDASEKVIRYLQQGDCIAVMGEEGSWMHVEWLTADGKTHQGWVLKLDLQVQAWVPQKQQTPDYRFEIGWTDTTQTDDYAPTALAIKIVSLKNEKPPQIIERAQDEPSLFTAPDDAIQVRDCNFDGYPDLEIFAHSGGAGPNFGNDYYLYNPEKQAFEYNEEFSALIQPEIDTIQKRIHSSWRSGAGNHGAEVYTVTNGNLDMLQRWERNCILPSLFCVWYEGKRIDGKWVETERRSAFLANGENGQAVHIPIFEKPDGKQIDSVSNSEVVVLQENACWMLVEYDAQPLSQTAKKGWIRKDVFGKDWQLKAQTQRFQLEIAPETETTAGWNGIRIMERKTNQVYQVILPDFSLFPSDSLIHIGDYTFDGQPDFRIESDITESTLQKQQRYEYYLFNSQTSYFERDSLLSDQPNVVFDKKSKTVKTEWFTQTGEEYQYHKKHYKRVKNSWQLLESWEGNFQSELCGVTHRKWQNGQWTEQVETIPLKTILPKPE